MKITELDHITDAMTEDNFPMPPIIDTAELDKSLDFLARLKCPWNDCTECCKDYKECDGKCSEHENNSKGDR